MPDVFTNLADNIGDAAGFLNDNVVKPTISAIDSVPVVGPYLAPAALALSGNPELAALYAGVSTGEKTGSPLSGLLAGAGSYAGNAVGASLGQSVANGLGGTVAQTPANALGNLFGGSAVGAAAPFGSFVGNALGSSSIGSIGGAALGGNVGAQAASGLNPQSPQLDAVPGFSPSQQPSLGLPQSLSQLSGLDPTQQTTNIASKGVYGGGQGPQENNYFLNQINRQLFDQNGNVQSNLNLPQIDMSYLNQLGISGSTPTDILKGISQYSA